MKIVDVAPIFDSRTDERTNKQQEHKRKVDWSASRRRLESFAMSFVDTTTGRRNVARRVVETPRRMLQDTSYDRLKIFDG